MKEFCLQFWVIYLELLHHNKSGNGIRQGGVNSGLLFTFYINEILKRIAERNIGCSLGHYRVNIIAYADDLIIVAPSVEGLRLLIDDLTSLSFDHALKINIEKTYYIIFKWKRNIMVNSRMFMNGSEVKRVQSCNYLGVVFDENLSSDCDIERCLKSFYKQFNSMFYRFNFIDRDQLMFLFTSYCTSFYGCELWFDALEHKNLIKHVGMAYHGAIKRMLGLSKYHNNHFSCKSGKVLMFNHLLITRMITFLFNLCFNDSNCLFYLRDYFKYDSKICYNVSRFCQTKYGIGNVFENCLPAIKSRIQFVQNNEESSGYIPQFVNR